MTQQEERLQAFFVRYGEALAAGDLPTIADCYAVPALVLSDAGSIPVAAREARPTIVGSEAITERLVFANVRWDYLDEQGSSAQQEGYRYVLRLDDGARPRIQVVILAPLD
jgi:hypothetical protein